MKTVKYLLLSFLISISFVLFYSCDKDPQEEEQTLPPITTEGLNTFGCLINGEVWVPERKYDIQCNYYPRHEFLDERLWGVLSMQIYKNKNKEGLLSITHDSLLGTGNYYLLLNKGTAHLKGGVGRVRSFKIPLDTYETTNKKKNTLNIVRLDTINRIISGTFEFDAVNENEPYDTIKVREGRFDVEFRY